MLNKLTYLIFVLAFFEPLKCQEPIDCCPVYDNNFWNTNANIISINGNNATTILEQQCMKRGDSYTVKCNSGFINNDEINNTDVSHLWSKGYGGGPNLQLEYVGVATSYQNCMAMVRAQYPYSNGVSVELGGIGACYAEINMEYVNLEEGWEVINFDEIAGNFGLEKTFEIQSEGECFESLTCEVPVKSGQCCPAYDNNLWNINANIVAINGIPADSETQKCMKEGDNYIVKCNDGFYGRSGSNLIVENIFKVYFDSGCFKPFVCQSEEAFQDCFDCPVYDNNSWNWNANIISINGLPASLVMVVQTGFSSIFLIIFVFVVK